MRRILCWSLLLMTLPAFSQSAIDPSLLAGMKARNIGPAGMSGRIAAIDVVRRDPSVIYVGAATGGVWKSVNGGLTFKPIFDDQPVHAVGAIAINQQNPDVVWVGTGEANTRNSVSIGNGIYRSLDAGRTWQHMGLEESERIHRIIVHPTDANTLYVAATGKLWGPSEQRGVFKTTDGGQTWQRILYVDDQTGCGELRMDPSNPNKLIANMWQFRRWPYFFNSGGASSGLYITYDGGQNWQRLEQEDGLPKGDLGRIGIAFAPSAPHVVYALVEAKANVLLRSEDGGHHWTTVNESPKISGRPFYYADIHVDPKNENRVFRLETLVHISEDGGRNFKVLKGASWPAGIHPDHHALWINPADPRHLLLGNDGGIAESRDRGQTFRFVANLPLAQFYHIAVDMERPYNVYGGLQDNGSWRGPSTVYDGGGLRNHYWRLVSFGDGFDTRPNPNDAMTGYSMSQGGNLMRWDLRTNTAAVVAPSPISTDVKLRFNWSAALAIDPFDSNVIYYGSQFVHRSNNQGSDWEIISGDLTTNNPEWQKQAESGGLTPDVTAAENYTTLVTINPSNVKQGVIWAGSDDGRIHVTQDGGQNWTSVENGLKGVPKNMWVAEIEPSNFDAGTAFAMLDDHRRSNFETYVFKTQNYGKTWQRLATKGVRGYALSLEQDVVNANLLFLGTEFGLWVSLDGGSNWFQWTHGVPTVSAMDLALHPRDHDLVIGTHGRGVFIIDDIRPLRQLTEAISNKSLHFFEVADAQQHRFGSPHGTVAPGQEDFQGPLREYGALINFIANGEQLPLPDPEAEKQRQVKLRAAKSSEEAGEGEPEGSEKGEAAPPSEVEVIIFDAQDREIRRFKEKAHRGLNRIQWNLKREPLRPAPGVVPPDDETEAGYEVSPGVYTIALQFGDQSQKQQVTVLPDPNLELQEQDWQQRDHALQRLEAINRKAVAAIERVEQIQTDVATVKSKVGQQFDRMAPDYKESVKAHPLTAASDSLLEKLKTFDAQLRKPKDVKGYTEDVELIPVFQMANYVINSTWQPPTPARMGYLNQVEQQLTEFLDGFNSFLSAQVADYAQQVSEANIALLGGMSEPIE